MKTSLSEFFEKYKNLQLDKAQKDKIYHQFLSKIDTNFADNQSDQGQDDTPSRLDRFYWYLKNYIFWYRLALGMLVIVIVMFSGNIKDFILNNYIWQEAVYADSIGQIVKVDGKYAVVIDNIPYQTNKIYNWSVMILQPWSKVDFIVNEKISWNIYWPAKLSFKKVWNEYTLNLLEWDQLELHSIKPDVDKTQLAKSDTTNNTTTDQNTVTTNTDDMKVTLTTTKFIAKTTDKEIDLKVSTHGTNQVIVNQNWPIELTNTKWETKLLASNEYAIVDNEIKLFKDMAMLSDSISNITPELTTVVSTDKDSNLDELKDIYDSTKNITNSPTTDKVIAKTDDNVTDSFIQDNSDSVSFSTFIADTKILSKTSDIQDSSQLALNAKIATNNINEIDTTISQDATISADKSSTVNITRDDWSDQINEILTKKRTLSKEQLTILELLSTNYIPWWSSLSLKSDILKWCRLFNISCLDTDDESLLKAYLQNIFSTVKNLYYITNDIKIIDIR